MIHTLMEVDSHPTVPPTKVRGPTGLPFGTLRHHCKQNRMSKRERSPEESDTDADRPLKRVAGRYLQEIRLSTIPSGNTSRQNSEDWVKQAGGLRIDSPLSEGTHYFGNVTTEPIGGVVGLGPTASVNMDEDIDMAEEAESTLPVDSASQNDGNSTVGYDPSNSFLQQIEQRRTVQLNMSRHPYGTWAQTSSRVADSSGPMINIVPATPAHSQQSLILHETSAQSVNPLSHRGQTQFMLQAQRERVATPPLSESTAMSAAAAAKASFHQEPALHHLVGTKRRITFGPRLDCEKCKQGEVHFTHFDYQ